MNESWSELEAEIRLGFPFKESWDFPDLGEANIELYRRRNKPLAWRALIDPHLFFFYNDYYHLEEALKKVHRFTTTSVRVKRKSMRVQWRSLKKTEALDIAVKELGKDHAKFYPFGLLDLLYDIEEFRKSRERLRKSRRMSDLPSVGATIFLIEADSTTKEELQEAVSSGVLETLLLKGRPERVFLWIVAKSAKSIPASILPFVEFGIFVGEDNERYAKPFITEDTYVYKPLVFRDHYGWFYQKHRNHAGEIYDRRYSLNEIGEEILTARKVEADGFVDWIEGLDDGN